MLKPTQDRVVVRRLAEEKTAGGILLPDTKDKPLKGEVLAVGPGAEKEVMHANGEPVRTELDVTVGDIVYFVKYAGTDIEHEGEKLTVMPQREIIAVVPRV